MKLGIAASAFAMILCSAHTSLAGDAARGKAIAEQTCMGCHGVQALVFRPVYPKLFGQNERYLILQLENFRAGKRPSLDMKAVAQNLTDADIKDVAAYFSGVDVCAPPPELN